MALAAERELYALVELLDACTLIVSEFGSPSKVSVALHDRSDLSHARLQRWQWISGSVEAVHALFSSSSADGSSSSGR